MKRNRGLTGAGCHGEQDALFALQERLYGTVDGDFLIVTLPFTDGGVGRRENFARRLVIGYLFGGAESLPQLAWCGKRVKLPLSARCIIELGDAVTIGRIGKFHSQKFSVVLRLLESIARKFVRRFGFNDREHEIPRIAQQVVGALRRPATRPISHHHDAAVGEALLLADLIIVPARVIEFRQDVFSAGVGFRDHCESGRELGRNFGRILCDTTLV